MSNRYTYTIWLNYHADQIMKHQRLMLYALSVDDHTLFRVAEKLHDHHLKQLFKLLVNGDDTYARA